jgi:hypothetical protein
MRTGASQLSTAAAERLAFLQVDSIYRTVRTAIHAITICVVAYFALQAIRSLAGTNTSVFVSIILNALVDLKFVFSVTLAGSCAVWAICERKLRHRKVADLSGRLRMLEQEIDPNRSSSQLTAHGKTNPSDRRG